MPLSPLLEAARFPPSAAVSRTDAGADRTDEKRAVAALSLAQFILAVVLQLGLTLHVDSTPTRSSSATCIFVIKNQLVEGGRQTTCLRSVNGVPSAGAVLTSGGTMTFALKRGTIRARVTSLLRFGRDGVHAVQRVSGTVVAGTGAFRGYHGTVTGYGTVVDRPIGLGHVAVTYRFRLSR